MPFFRTGKNTYRSITGRKWTAKQVKLYYATNGFKKKVRRRKK